MEEEVKQEVQEDMTTEEVQEEETPKEETTFYEEFSKTFDEFSKTLDKKLAQIFSVLDAMEQKETTDPVAETMTEDEATPEDERLEEAKELYYGK